MQEPEIICRDYVFNEEIIEFIRCNPEKISEEEFPKKFSEARKILLKEISDRVYRTVPKMIDSELTVKKLSHPSMIKTTTLTYKELSEKARNNEEVVFIVEIEHLFNCQLCIIFNHTIEGEFYVRFYGYVDDKIISFGNVIKYHSK